ncbi:autotransporter assembly complex protein TamA [Rhodopila sp.]|uniref:autotransporter assembly complex protein TamA n=1 Tax=Rhodopila sp. TaxID=2480087 RepID=UPI003D0EB32C
MTLKPTGNGVLDAALHDSASLISLRASAPTGGFALTERARQDVGRFKTALQSFGYYKASVHLTIDGKTLDDPGIFAALDQAPASPPIAVVVSFDLGPRFQLGQVTISTPVPADIPGQLDLRSGQPAMAADVLAAQGRLLSALREDGYPMAKVPIPLATLRPDENRLDVEFQPDAGPKTDIGPISFSGLKDMNESFVRRRLTVHPGELFTTSAIDTARQDLTSIGVFSVVRAVPADALDPQGQLPITFDLTERPLHAVDLGVAYSTDVGINVTTGWHDHNLFGNAEQLNLTAAVQLGGNAVTRPGYNVGAQFIKPDYLVRDQSLEIDVNAIDQSLQAYQQTALLEKIALNRKLTPHWTASLGLSGEQESILQEDVTRHYELVGIPASLRYDNTTSLLAPTSGIRASLTVTPTESLGTTSATFFITQLAGSTYLDLFDNGRSILALRGLVGKDFGAGVFSLPPDQRFYAGGSGTVRGYRFQTLGPQFANRIPTGGTAISAGTVELRQRILGSYGIATFLDVGQVSSNGAPFTSNWHAGAGIGARYYTSIGPIRLDVAVPLNKLPGGDSLELYIGIGEAF